MKNIYSRIVIYILTVFLLSILFSSQVNEVFPINNQEKCVCQPKCIDRLMEYQKYNQTMEDLRLSVLNDEPEEGPFEFMLPEDPDTQLVRPRTTSRVPVRPERKLTTGTVFIAVLLIEFKLSSHSSIHSPAYYQDLLFNHSNPKSMASYYWETSYGKLNLTGEILGKRWYRSSFNASYWGDDKGTVFPNVDNKNDKIYNLVAEAVQLADPDVNFTRFDTDKNSVVDHLVVIHAGNAQERAGGVPSDIWSHRWQIPFHCLVDAAKVKDYTMCAETSPMGTFAHELGHDLADLPDLYDTDYSSDGIGRWGIMAGGAWNYDPNPASGESPGDTPAHFCAWSKIQLGWITPTLVLDNLTAQVLPTIQTTGKNSVLKMYMSNQTRSVPLKEYFLIVNRQQIGFDSFIPGQGILIWHIDECVDGANDGEQRKLVDLEEADANFDPGGPWEQLDYRATPPPVWASVPDDDGSSTDPWAVGSQFVSGSIPSSFSNNHIITYINISVSATSTVDIFTSHEPYPWDYTLLLMNRSSINTIDKEPSLIEHASGIGGISTDFSVIWQSNRTGNWELFGSQTKDGGKTWIPAIQITNNSFPDYSPSLTLWYPPAYIAAAFGVDKENKPIAGTEISKLVQPPPEYHLAFVSNRTGNPEIFHVKSKDFLIWTTPTQLTNHPQADIDPCLITTPAGNLGLFWAANRSGNLDIFFIEDPWATSSTTQVTTYSGDDKNPSYFCTENKTHLLAFQRKVTGVYGLHLLKGNTYLSLSTHNLVYSNLSTDSIEPSIFGREDGTLALLFTSQTSSGESIFQTHSSDWTLWSSPHQMGIPTNASNPSLIESNCGALFMAYTSYNATRLPHVYLMHTTLCHRFGIGIRYPDDTGDSFFNPIKVEQTSDWVFVGEAHLNQSDMTTNPALPPDGYLLIDVNDTGNTYDTSDDEIILSDIYIHPGDFPVIIDPIGLATFEIPLSQFQAMFGFLPTATILQISVKWKYFNLYEEETNVNAFIYVELLSDQEHLQFHGNLPIPTSYETPLVSQPPIIQGYVDYGVESFTMELYEENDTDPYYLQTMIISEVAKATGNWYAFIPQLKDYVITKIIATSNGVYPRKTATLYVQKEPWDTTPPILNHLGPIDIIAESFPIIFSEEITDTLNNDYGVNESAIQFHYRILSQETTWNHIFYSIEDENWAKFEPDKYEYSLDFSTLIGENETAFIEYYWTAADLASPANVGIDGSKSSPYIIGLGLYRTTTIYVPISSTTTQTTTTSTQPAPGFELWFLLFPISLLVLFLKQNRFRR